MFVSPAIYFDALILLLGDNSDRSKALVKELLTATETDKVKGRDITSTDNDLIDVYKDLIRSVISENISQDNQSTAKILLVRIQSNDVIKSYPLIKDLLTDILSGAEPVSANQIDNCLKRIRNMLVMSDLDEYTRKVFARTRRIPDIQDPDAQAAELAQVKAMLDDTVKQVEYRQKTSEAKESETYVKISDRESMLRSINVFMERNVKGVIKTGLIGLNKALGSRGGFAMGESVVFAAPSHNFKSGMLISVARWAIVYNDFHALVEPGKRAMVYLVSLENEVSHNLMEMFKSLFGLVEKKLYDPTLHTPEFVTDWLQSYFAKFNVELLIDRYTPHEFSFGLFNQRFNYFTGLGYQIVVFILDYLSISRGVDPGDTISSGGLIQMIRENYSKYINHAKSCGYLFATGHQLTKKADEISTNGGRYPVKKFNPSMMADSSDVFRDIDMLFFMYLEKNIDDVKFLTLRNAKNRGCNDTPERDKFTCYAFSEFGIEDDINDIPRYTTDIDDWSQVVKAPDADQMAENLF